ncbi:hypothetical protein NDU88_005537 [Pleurodeles waltl]|uniref:Uncharacterized protein n=1 Tax=Pleurodeles waltl TaxID=8319 RepID=A0AAV7MAU0_PLEWA|nr:hypothetical protein NDU88_005537 [Pleurodeles waltl]
MRVELVMVSCRRRVVEIVVGAEGRQSSSAKALPIDGPAKNYCPAPQHYLKCWLCGLVQVRTVTDWLCTWWCLVCVGGPSSLSLLLGPAASLNLHTCGGGPPWKSLFCCALGPRINASPRVRDWGPGEERYPTGPFLLCRCYLRPLPTPTWSRLVRSCGRKGKSRKTGHLENWGLAARAERRPRVHPADRRGEGEQRGEEPLQPWARKSLSGRGEVPELAEREQGDPGGPVLGGAYRVETWACTTSSWIMRLERSLSSTTISFLPRPRAAEGGASLQDRTGGQNVGALKSFEAVKELAIHTPQDAQHLKF